MPNIFAGSYQCLSELHKKTGSGTYRFLFLENIEN